MAFIEPMRRNKPNITYLLTPTIDAIQRKLQHIINRLEKWTLKNGFTISKNKTVAMHFCPDKKCGSCFEIGQ